MKKLLLLLSLWCCSALAQPLQDVRILRVLDGDSIVIHAPFLPNPLKPELTVRLYGIDTPEKGHLAKCAEEDRRSRLAADFVKNQIASAKRHQVVYHKWDKYGGRVLGDFILDGRSLTEMLIRSGYAREYYGEAKQSWCR